jgi:hypothetical protein
LPSSSSSVGQSDRSHNFPKSSASTQNSMIQNREKL